MSSMTGHVAVGATIASLIENPQMHPAGLPPSSGVMHVVLGQVAVDTEHGRGVTSEMEHMFHRMEQRKET